jgi:hypothetical protein
MASGAATDLFNPGYEGDYETANGYNARNEIDCISKH